jgi:hypothetical protein
MHFNMVKYFYVKTVINNVKLCEYVVYFIINKEKNIELFLVNSYRGNGYTKLFFLYY